MPLWTSRYGEDSKKRLLLMVSMEASISHVYIDLCDKACAFFPTNVELKT